MAEREFHMTILGRTIEHLGSQMYKHRAPSIAELVANCWDAGASKVEVTIPEPSEVYEASRSSIVILDDGEGMDADSIQERYLVVGRNRRSEDNGENRGRRVMGRKGIGKLAGFGLAEKVSVTTWTPDSLQAIEFTMELSRLKGDAGRAHEIRFPWTETDKASDWPPSGTMIRLSELKHSSPIDVNLLVETLGRRFSRTIRGQMEILVNCRRVEEPTLEVMHEFPDEGTVEEHTLPGGQVIKYRYRFASRPIHSKELQGFVIYTNERTAQAPPFFFDVESTASSQHSTRYVTGEILADYLDQGIDDESDYISTDRQELDWEKDELRDLREWGKDMCRRVLRECAELRGQQVENWILSDETFASRLIVLDLSTQKEIGSFLRVLGQKSEENDPRTRDLADSLIKAYEFRTFHDVIGEIREAGEDPDKLEYLLGRLHDWKVLESRAILEIIRGRLGIVNKLQDMIIKNAPETASSKTHDNLHDLMAEYPWIFNPEWQVFAEEKSLGKQLREWGERDCPEEMKAKRVDFLAFAGGEDELVIIELKRPGHAVEFAEIQRLDNYQVELMKARPNCHRVLVYGGTVNIPKNKWDEIMAAKDFEAIEWSKMFARVRKLYGHYEAVLEGDVRDGSFRTKQSEVARTRQILANGTVHRAARARRLGLGNSDP